MPAFPLDAPLPPLCPSRQCRGQLHTGKDGLCLLILLVRTTSQPLVSRGGRVDLNECMSSMSDHIFIRTRSRERVRSNASAATDVHTSSHQSFLRGATGSSWPSHILNPTQNRAGQVVQNHNPESIATRLLRFALSFCPERSASRSTAPTKPGCRATSFGTPCLPACMWRTWAVCCLEAAEYSQTYNPAHLHSKSKPYTDKLEASSSSVRGKFPPDFSACVARSYP